MTIDPGHTAERLRADTATDFERFIPLVFHWANRLTRNHDQSMDVVQDVYLKWNQQCRRGAPDRPEAWLRVVTTRRVFELMRSPQLRVVNRELVERSAGSHDGPVRPGPDSDLLRDDVLQSLGRLTEMQRNVVLAKIMDQKTFAAIASDFDVSISTIKTHYLRAVRVLRETLSGRWKDQ